MSDNNINNVFEEILQPVAPLINNAQELIPKDSETYTLSLKVFTTNLLYAIICQIPSIGRLVVEIKTSPTAKKLCLVAASKSMYSEAFVRYNPEIFRKIFSVMLEATTIIGIPEINQLGQIWLVDGSVFPAISTMSWAKYKKGANAIKLQMAFELNRMIPVSFLSTTGNYSEKKFLQDILEQGITYICDRGYISFDLFKRICDAKAWFIIRGKEKLKCIYEESFDIDVPTQFISFFKEIKDSQVVFINDSNQKAYRMVEFKARGELYRLITNRFDLSTYEIIMLYAYRWQVELCFRFLKRTLKGINLFSHDCQGIQIQFYLYMIAYLLLLSFKQKCITSNTDGTVSEVQDQAPYHNSRNNSSSGRTYVCGLVTLLGDKLKHFWRIGIHWLVAVRNSLLMLYDDEFLKILGECT